MEHILEVGKFIAHHREGLVAQFEYSESTNSPAAVLDVVVQPVKDQLVQVLPRGIGVESGIAFDSNGSTSQ